MRLPRNIQNIGLVTLIAMLIWLYAEGQDVRDASVDLELRPPPTVEGSEQVFDLLQADEQLGPIDANATFKGAGASLSRLLAAWADGTVVLNIDAGDLPAEIPPDRRVQLSTAELLAKTRLRGGDPSSPTVSELGLSVVAVEPEQVTVLVDRLERRSVPVRLVHEGVKLDGEPTLEPAQVTVTMLESLEVSVVDAIVPRLPTMAPGQYEGVTAHLQLPPALLATPSGRRHLRLHRETVEATFTKAAQRRRIEWPASPPVWVFGRPSAFDAYDLAILGLGPAGEPIETNTPLGKVTIEGPASLIEQMKNNPDDYTVIARLDLHDAKPDVQNIRWISAIEIGDNTGPTSQTLAVVPLTEAARLGASGDAAEFQDDQRWAIDVEKAPRVVVRLTPR